MQYAGRTMCEHHEEHDGDVIDTEVWRYYMFECAMCGFAHISQDTKSGLVPRLIRRGDDIVPTE